VRGDTSRFGNSLQPNSRDAVGTPIKQRAALDADRSHEGVLTTEGCDRLINRVSMSHAPIMQISCTFGKRIPTPELLHLHPSGWVRPSAVNATSHKLLVGDRLRMAIEALGKRPVDVCRIFDVAPSKLGNWMRGEHYPDPWFIVRFCDRFNVTADFFYRGRVSSAMDAPLADALWAKEEAAQRAQLERAAQEPEAEKTS